MFKLAYRNIFRQPIRSLLTLVIIIFGVVGLILMGGFVEDTFFQLQETTIHSQVGHLQINKANYLAQGRREPYKFLLDTTHNNSANFAAWPEVEAVMMRINFSGLANNNHGNYPIIGEGVEPDKEAKLGSLLKIVEGRQLSTSDKTGILVGKGVAKALGVKAGDYLTLLANTTEGALNSLEFQVIGIFQTFSKAFDERAVRISLDAAHELLATEGIHSIVISLNSTNQTDTVLNRLSSLYPNTQYEITPWYRLADFYQKTVDLYRRQFGVLELVILIMVLLSVVNSVSMAMYERTGEFGTLKALGIRPNQLFRLALAEYFLLGLMGGVIGCIVGIILAQVISAIGITMPPMPNSDMAYTAHILIVPWVLYVSMAVGVSASLLASIFPAWKACRIPIIEGLQANI